MNRVGEMYVKVCSGLMAEDFATGIEKGLGVLAYQPE